MKVIGLKAEQVNVVFAFKAYSFVLLDARSHLPQYIFCLSSSDTTANNDRRQRDGWTIDVCRHTIAQRNEKVFVALWRSWSDCDASCSSAITIRDLVHASSDTQHCNRLVTQKEDNSPTKTEYSARSSANLNSQREAKGRPKELIGVVFLVRVVRIRQLNKHYKSYRIKQSKPKAELYRDRCGPNYKVLIKLHSSVSGCFDGGNIHVNIYLKGNKKFINFSL
ncbi:hypothetical protein TcasGA2_TC013288 [Tribolium castaneum]|uniref:Uncharacterized protein n=1 Tax=Tribolium castaneum TaxID=7070 RepID=D6WP38_TRICA|nr:hypothetical protein TcasGA2_TC013288 [Tribolium castaneum]